VTSAPPIPSAAIRADVSLRWLLFIFIGGLLLVIGLRIFFANLQDELREKSANERARLFVGEEIVRGIHGIEKDLYRMVVTGNATGLSRINKAVDAQLQKLTHDLVVLQQGGSVRRQVQLNLEGRDEMVREVIYRPDAGDTSYVMEAIEIGPLLEQIPLQSRELTTLLERRWDCVERANQTCLYGAAEEIAIFAKHLPPLFERLDENANRLFFDSSERLRGLESELTKQRERLKLVEVGLIALVVVLAGLAGIMVMRRINGANLKLSQALATARAARDEAQRASRAKSEFVSRMSHELRTPLNAIIGFAELLEAEPLPPSQKGYVALINSSGKHLMELINAVLDHAKIEAGGLTLEEISYDFPAAIEAVRSIAAERATAKGLGFVADIAPDLPRFVRGDPTRLRQILINLLVNAVKFTEQGTVELRVAVDDSLLVFSIRDSGIGMSPEGLERLFQPFGQADESITRKYGGTGLGLMISKELTEAMGGSIEVESAPDVGTCFWVRIPLLAATMDLAAEPAHLPVGSTGDFAGLIGGRVLLVDDNRVNQQLGSAMLSRLGLAFDVAENGVHALQCINQNDYALVLMDMEMPEMDGLTATVQIRHNESTTPGPADAADRQAHLTIIAMTANALAEDRERCFEAGMDGYIAKPISLAALQAEIQRLFGAAKSTMPVSMHVTEINGPIFSRATVIDMLGDEALYEELSGMFIADVPGYLTELDAALAAEDWNRLARAAHTLKSLFATFAAAAPESDGRALEQAAQQGDAARCADGVRAVKAQTVALAHAMGTTPV
jgi:signal transduction histidine kinase/CheY-like chemotaxis protein/HPt (histidine-containing phosphotransfer) domain-containing protein